MARFNRQAYTLSYLLRAVLEASHYETGKCVKIG